MFKTLGLITLARVADEVATGRQQAPLLSRTAAASAAKCGDWVEPSMMETKVTRVTGSVSYRYNQGSMGRTIKDNSVVISFIDSLPSAGH